jgi:hypothetical protein
MSPLASSFINYVSSITPGLRQARQYTIDYWAPDMAPATIAFADLGVRVVDDFTAVGASVNKAVLQAIECALAKGDAQLTLVVANGMVEGIVERALEVGLWDDIRPMLGPFSGSHADSWVWFRTHNLPRLPDDERRAPRSAIRH